MESYPESAWNLDVFIYCLSLIYDGILNEKGRTIYEKYCQGYLSKPISPFEIILVKGYEIVNFEDEFLKYKRYEDSMK